MQLNVADIDLIIFKIYCNNLQSNCRLEYPIYGLCIAFDFINTMDSKNIEN